MEQDRFIEFESEIGNKLVAPAQWLTEGEGTTWYLRSPDDHAAISVFTYTAEGSGSLDEFGDLIAIWSLPDGETDWQKSTWNSIALGAQRALVTCALCPELRNSGCVFTPLIRAGSTTHSYSVCLPLRWS